MRRTVVINVVGLSGSLLKDRLPTLAQFASQGSRASISPAFPAVTTTAQSNYVTGQPPTEHGIVGNGWYHRELAEVQFWKQPESLVRAPKLWEALKAADPQFTCAKLFWWYNMVSSADYSITPRPMYPADGRKVFDIYSWPYAIREEIKKDLGPFPFPTFWGPAAGVKSPQGTPDAASRWIAESAKWIERRHEPTLNLVYLPHLDYNLQRYGPRDERVNRDFHEIDAILEDLIGFFQQRGVQIVILSEYGIEPVHQPVHLNRAFRKRGWLNLKDELGLEVLDCGASRAFAVADHQVAHVYLNDSSIRSEVRTLLESTDGIGRVLDPLAQKEVGLWHERSGDLVVEAAPGSWFTYYYWEDDERAPDFARCVDIHRKPGYDPAELFIDPQIQFPRLKVAWRLLQKKLGFRMLMDLIPLQAECVKGSHGRFVELESERPVLLMDRPDGGLPESIESTDVKQILFHAIMDSKD